MKPYKPKDEPKIWGTTRQIFERHNMSCHLLHIKEGFACSSHSHKYRANGFHVISGSVAIETNDTAVRLTAGESLDVDPGTTHRFVAMTDAVMIEFYYVKDVAARDIERYVLGHAVSEDEIKRLMERLGE